MTRWVVPLLLLLAITLTAAITLALQPDTLDDGAMPARNPRNPAATAGPGPAVAGPGSEAGRGAGQAAERAREWADTTLSRPLFSPDRRPAAGATTAAGDAPTSLPRLAGIMMDGPRRSVIFAAADGARPTVVAEGGDLGGFHVQSVEASQVTVLGPDGTHVLRPSFDQHPAAPAAPAPSAGLPSLQGLQGLSGIPGLTGPGPVAR